MRRSSNGIEHPDTPVAAGMRFLVEVAAWLAILETWGWWALVVAVLLLTLFNARGDKRVNGVVVPGPVRLLLEIGVFLVGSWAMAQWLGPAAGMLMVLAVAALLFVGRARYRWLLSG